MNHCINFPWTSWRGISRVIHTHYLSNGTDSLQSRDFRMGLNNKKQQVCYLYTCVSVHGLYLQQPHISLNTWSIALKALISQIWREQASERTRTHVVKCMNIHREFHSHVRQFLRICIGTFLGCCLCVLSFVSCLKHMIINITISRILWMTFGLFHLYIRMYVCVWVFHLDFSTWRFLPSARGDRFVCVFFNDQSDLRT